MSSGSGPSSEYSDRDEAEVESALDRGWAEYETETGGGSIPTGIRVSAEIEWAGMKDRANNGHRTTKLDGLSLAAIRPALDRARELNRKAGEAQPAASYQAKGWHAQLRALTATPRGSAAADRAKLDPSARTLADWLAESRAPSKSNQEKIAAAYQELANWKVTTAKEEAAKANKEVATKLSDALADRYGGAEIRLRNITKLKFE